jgi:hypothetical protein
MVTKNEIIEQITRCARSRYLRLYETLSYDALCARVEEINTTSLDKLDYDSDTDTLDNTDFEMKILLEMMAQRPFGRRRGLIGWRRMLFA